jgi:hypothetical protein
MKRIFLVLILCTILPIDSYGEVDGNLLYNTMDACEKSGPAAANVGCAYSLGFTMAVLDTLTLVNATDESPGWARSICQPAELQATQIRDVVYQFLKTNPADRHQNAAGLTIAAYMRAWPCPKE